MATIEKRVDSTGCTTYRVKVRVKGYSPETASFQRRTDAKHWASNIESAMREGRHFNKPESKVRTLSESIERYQKEALPNLKDQSSRTYHLASIIYITGARAIICFWYLNITRVIAIVCASRRPAMI